MLSMGEEDVGNRIWMSNKQMKGRLVVVVVVAVWEGGGQHEDRTMSAAHVKTACDTISGPLCSSVSRNSTAMARGDSALCASSGSKLRANCSGAACTVHSSTCQAAALSLISGQADSLPSSYIRDQARERCMPATKLLSSPGEGSRAF